MLELAALLSLVTWRVTSLLYDESAFNWLRRWLKIEEVDGAFLYPDKGLGKMWSCFWCLSLIVALVVAAVIVPLTWFRAWLIGPMWLASAAGAVMVEKWIGRSKARW